MVPLAAILCRMHRISSDLRSYVAKGPVSTRVGDRLGTPSGAASFSSSSLRPRAAKQIHGFLEVFYVQSDYGKISPLFPNVKMIHFSKGRAFQDRNFFVLRERERERERERLAAGHQGLGQGNWGSAPAEVRFSRFFFAPFLSEIQRTQKTCNTQALFLLVFATLFPHAL